MSKLKYFLRQLIRIYTFPLLRYLGHKRNRLSLGLPESHYFFGEDALGSLNQVHKRYLTETGWIESKNANQSVRNGEYIPWTSYAFTHWVEHKNFLNSNILEFGSGASTIFWSSKFAKVVAIESDPNWLVKVREATVELNNVEVQNLISSKTFANEKFRNSYLDVFNSDLQLFPELRFTFEVINIDMIRAYISQANFFFVDGGPRNLFMKLLADLATENSVIFVDNSDQYYTSIGRDSLHATGFKEIEFRSLGPLNHSATSTSIFFKNLEFI